MNLHLWLTAKLLSRIARNAATCTMWKSAFRDKVLRWMWRFRTSIWMHKFRCKRNAVYRWAGLYKARGYYAQDPHNLRLWADVKDIPIPPTISR
jgi:hypothetical protein